MTGARVPTVSPLPLPPALRAELHGWALLAIGSLAMAGALALLLVLSRVPQTQVLLPWSWQSFFYTALVTHVILSFVVWVLAVLGAFTVLVTAAGGGPARRLGWLGPLGLALAAAGAVALVVPALLNVGEPELNNYVPIVVHPLYSLGLALVAAGVALAVIRLLVNPGGLRQCAGFAVGVAGICYLVALVCFALAGLALPAGLDLATLNERLFWGGGHVLQFVNTALMLAAWTAVAEQALGETPVPPALFRLVLGSMVAFVLAGAVFYGLFDVLGLEHRLAFTGLLWSGLTLPPVIVGGGLAALLIRRRADLAGSAAVQGLAISLAVFVVGGLMGFFLGASDARTPSHYHAAIGGVNLAFMALFVAVILPALGRGVRDALAWRPLHLYGWGQLVFSLGMFVAGAAGVPRKTMGAVAQGLDSPLKKVAMGVYGLGGVAAVVGGVLFIAVVLSCLLARKEPTPCKNPPMTDPRSPRTDDRLPADGRRWERLAVIGVGAVLVAAFVTMPAWRGVPQAAFESEAMDATAFEAGYDAMVARYRVGETEDGLPVVRPPPGDVYIAAERWRFRPVLELQAGQSYRLHVASQDILHGVVIAGHEALLVPGRAALLTLTPVGPGPISLVCSEYCGLEHNKMRSLMTVVEKE